jgi:SSS family solute:Na+ symporter
LQLVGLQVVIGAMGVTGVGWVGDIPLIIASLSWPRSPIPADCVRRRRCHRQDLLIYLTAFAAVIIIPIQLGGWGKIFAAVPPEKLLLATPQGQTTGQYGVYATLALGSAFALLLYPHTMTAILSATSGHTVRRNAALLPAYTFVLGLLALLGFFALAAGVDKVPEFAEGFRQFKNNFAVPALFLHSFPSWFAGVTFAAIGIGALVPAAIMSIAAANLFTRNVTRILPWQRHNKRNPRWPNGCRWWSSSARLCSFFVRCNTAIQLQLLGGIWIIRPCRRC